MPVNYLNNVPDLGTGIEEGVGISYAISEHLLSKKVSSLSESCEKISVFSTGAKINFINGHYPILSWNVLPRKTMLSGTLQHLLPQPALTGSKLKMEK